MTTTAQVPVDNLDDDYPDRAAAHRRDGYLNTSTHYVNYEHGRAATLHSASSTLARISTELTHPSADTSERLWAAIAQLDYHVGALVALHVTALAAELDFDTVTS